MAKELGIPIIALSQLSRAVETRKESKIPQLSDLRESGAIEQDADIVSFIYRPDYYGFVEDESGESNFGIGEIIIAKHRNGAQGKVRLRFVNEYARFDNLNEVPEYEAGNSDHRTSSLKPDAGTFTIPSKMNDTEKGNDKGDFDTSGIDDNPF